jgi:hypothetical protein
LNARALIFLESASSMYGADIKAKEWVDMVTDEYFNLNKRIK